MSKALEMCYLSMASSMSIAMQNASSNQKSCQTIATTGTTVICALIIAKGSAPSK